MQYYFFKNSSKNQSLIISFLIVFIGITLPIFSWASAPVFSPKDTTLVIEKDIYPKIVDKQERLIEGKKYIFATINERKGMVALSGNFLSEMARAAGIEVTDFLDWNDMKPTNAIQTGQVYYLQAKGNRAKDVATHTLLNNETLWDVSQKYAMRYKYLLKYNRLDENDKVKIGRVLWIQTKRPKKIPVEVRNVTPIIATFEEEGEDETAADPELMAEWEELKKTELAEVDNKEEDQKEKITTTTTDTKTDDNDATTNSEQGSFAEFDDTKKTEVVIISEKIDTKNNENVATNVVKYHTVAEAQSLYDVSKKYNVVMSKLKEWNNLADYTVSTGQRLIVSQPNSNQKDKVYTGSLITEKTDTKTTPSSDKKVVVKQNGNGDFVTFIDSSGVLLPVPQQDFTPIAPTTGDANYHIVEKDETLWSIARKYNLSPKDIIRWNGFITGDNIDVGDKIILKSSLAVKAGSRAEVIQNNTSSDSTSTGNNAAIGGDSEFKESILVDPAINGLTENNPSQNKIGILSISMEEFLARGGDKNNIKNIGKEGYDVIGDPILGYDFSQSKETKIDTTKTKTEETQTKAETYIVQPKDMLGKIAQKHGVTSKEMMIWNPKTAPNGSINIGDTLIVSKPQTTSTVTETTTTVFPVEYYGAGFHAVQPTQTVYHLSEKYGVPVGKIRSWNNLSEDIIDLPVGKKMIVNEGVLQMSNNTDTSVARGNTDATTQVNYNYHSVEKGETLFSVAQKYKISTAQLREWNGRQGDLVYEGEKLIIGIK